MGAQAWWGEGRGVKMDTLLSNVTVTPYSLYLENWATETENCVRPQDLVITC